jgi:predicted dinucleotide-binding enzyme
MIVHNLEANPSSTTARRVAFISADDDGAKKQVETAPQDLAMYRCGWSFVVTICRRRR